MSPLLWVNGGNVPPASHFVNILRPITLLFIDVCLISSVPSRCGIKKLETSVLVHSCLSRQCHMCAFKSSKQFYGSAMLACICVWGLSASLRLMFTLGCVQMSSELLRVTATVMWNRKLRAFLMLSWTNRLRLLSFDMKSSRPASDPGAIGKTSKA